MGITVEQIEHWMQRAEDEHLEFKEARRHFDFEKLVRYCAALSNEGEGRVVLGVTDKEPRTVIGCRAFDDIQRTKAGLVDRLRLRIEAEAVDHPNGPVIVFTCPPHPIGTPVQYKGAYWMRAGEDLVPMTPDMLRRIFDESGPDYSAEICTAATLGDLDPEGITRLRAMWARKSSNRALLAIPDEQLLADAELAVDGGITFAALILLGTREALGRHLGQAESVFEYRSTESSLPAHQRKEYRQGFLLFYDDLWETINLRNEVQQFAEGMFMMDVPTFNEVAIREAILNAVAHRDYRLAGSVFVRQYPRRLEIVSPGGFPAGVTEDNVLWRQLPRNRRLAEAFAKCGLVERSGQGMNRMFEECIKEGKPTPDFSGTDGFQVSVTIRGEVQDPTFLRFLQQVGAETTASFTTQDFLVIDLIHREQSINEALKSRIPNLIERGVIERLGKGRGASYTLSRRFYGFIGKGGVYTRKTGLDRETNKELLLKHIRGNARKGSQLSELRQVLPASSRSDVQGLLRSLRDEERVHSIGYARGARWFPGKVPE